MSQAKLAAARELIEEHHYAAARAVLETIDDPKAYNWLAKLDQIAPQAIKAPMSNEAAQYYRAENRKRTVNNLFKAFNAFVVGGVCLIAFATLRNSNPQGPIGLECLLLPASGFFFFLMVLNIKWRRG